MGNQINIEGTLLYSYTYYADNHQLWLVLHSQHGFGALIGEYKTSDAAWRATTQLDERMQRVELLLVALQIMLNQGKAGDVKPPAQVKLEEWLKSYISGNIQIDDTEANDGS